MQEQISSYMRSQIHHLFLATKDHKEKKTLETIPMKSFWPPEAKLVFYLFQ
jgi:hypothetical protein